MCSNCLQIFKVCHVAKGMYVFRVIPKYRRGQVVFIGRQISLWHKSKSFLRLEPPAVERRGCSFPPSFQISPFPNRAGIYQEKSHWVCERPSEMGCLGISVAVDWRALGLFFFFKCWLHSYSCGHKDSPKCAWTLGRYLYQGGGQPGNRGGFNPTLLLYGVLQVIKHSHNQKTFKRLSLIIRDLYFSLWLLFSTMNN